MGLEGQEHGTLWGLSTVAGHVNRGEHRFSIPTALSRSLEENL